MKKLFGTIVILASLAVAPVHAAPVKYNIDKLHAWVNFKLGHLGFAQTLGSMHSVTGAITFDKNKPEASSVSATIDVKSVHTGFDKRDAWVTSDKVMNAAKNPTITFVSKKIEVTGKATANIAGDLTMNGVTKPVVLATTFNKIGANPRTKKETLGFSATAKVKRSDFGVKAFVGPLGDMVNVTIELEAIRAD